MCLLTYPDARSCISNASAKCCGSVATLRELQPITGGGKYLFSSLRTKVRPISDATLNAVLKRR
jgi:hypothetical protein